MFLGQDGTIMDFDKVEVDGVMLLDDPLVEACSIREQKDRSVMDLGEATVEDDYSEDSFPHVL